MLTETPATLDIKLRNTPPEMVGFVRHAVQQHPSKSISAYIKDLIAKEMVYQRKTRLKSVLALRKKLDLKFYDGPHDAVALVRAIRDGDKD